MKTVHATYEAGVFRPHGQVDLPEHSEVEFEPRPAACTPSVSEMQAIYQVLSERFESGQCDVAARHDEHQP